MPIRRLRALATAVLLIVPSTVAAQESRSSALAVELTKMMDEMKLDSVAARQTGDDYVGALYIPGSQLLVVGAKFAPADRMTYLLGQKNYRDVYVDLSSASEQKTRIFVMDLGANGLRFKRETNQPFDTVDAAGKSVVFDGDWGKAKISEDEYRKAFTSSDERYSQMLQALITALKKPS
jgi:hypothetical protein